MWWRMATLCLPVLSTILAGCTSPPAETTPEVSLEVDARRTWEPSVDQPDSRSGGHVSCSKTETGTKLDVTVRNHAPRLYALDETRWRLEWDGGNSIGVIGMSGAREVSPEGTAQVVLYGCPPNDRSTLTEVFLFDVSATEPSAEIVASSPV